MVPRCTSASFLTVLSVLSITATRVPAGQPADARPSAVDPGQWTVPLNGAWQFASEGSSDFEPAKVPGFWGSTPQGQKAGYKVTAQWKTGTYRREFQVPPNKTGAVVEFEQLRWGGQVLVNGKAAGTYDLGHSPAIFDISPFIKPGTNILEVRPRGWPVLERHAGKDIQIPIGAGNWFGPKDGGIVDDVYLRFHNGARIEPLRITGHAAGLTCDVVTCVVASGAPWQGTVVAQVRSDDGKEVLSEAKRTSIRLEAGKAVDVDLAGIAAAGAKVWSLDNPALYRMVIWLEDASGKVVAVRDDTFGFRDISVRDGKFCLNGKPLRLFGATELVMYSMLQLLDDDVRMQNVQVKLFKAMNGVAFRTHQNPLPRKWLDVCDRSGILVFCEWPNFPDVQRQDGESPYEVPEYWKNLQRESRGLIGDRFNHPSIVGWVPSNEGSTFGDWERQNLVPFVKQCDPTRLVMLSGDFTPDVADTHNFSGLWWGTQADFERAARDLARCYADRPTSCTEYGQYGPSARWYGPHEFKGDSPQVQQDLARMLMEQTETLRRARFQVIMPFSYGWYGEKAAKSGRYEDAAQPYHALRNALAPLGVSIDFLRHVVAGDTVQVPVWVLSDAEDAAGAVGVNLYLLDRHPGYNWDGQVRDLHVLARGHYETKIAAWQAYRQGVSLTIPATPGQVYLAGVVRKQGQSQSAAISIRPLRIHPALPKITRPLKVGVIEKDGRIARWLKSRGHEIVLAYGDQTPDVLVIGEGRLYDSRIRTHGGPLARRVRDGVTRMVILEQGQWEASIAQSDMRPLLAGLTTAGMTTAVENLFPREPLSAIVGDELDFQRLNGMENVGARVLLVPTGQAKLPVDRKAPARLAPEAEKAAATSQAAVPAALQADAWSSLLDAYGLKAEVPGWAVAHRTFGKGEVYACQVPIVDRLERDNTAEYDPTCERLLIYLVEESAAPQE